jgi:hypothetical protein
VRADNVYVKNSKKTDCKSSQKARLGLTNPKHSIISGNPLGAVKELFDLLSIFSGYCCFQSQAKKF